MRQLFTQLLETKATCLAPFFWGAGGDADQLQVQLAFLAHGVPRNQSHDRARLGLHAIGVTPIQQAITSLERTQGSGLESQIPVDPTG